MSHLDPARGVQVERLQQKLEEAHGGDYNALARAYRSLLQHIQALQIEAQVAAIDNWLLVLGIFAKAAVQSPPPRYGRHIMHYSHLSVRLLTQCKTYSGQFHPHLFECRKNDAPHAPMLHAVLGV